jgi:hypothetical protein
MPGKVTVADCWTLLPYENLLATAEVSAEELIEIVREDGTDIRSDRTLWPFEIEMKGDAPPVKFLHRGQPVKDGQRFTIAFNSYDAQSGGRRLMRLREIVFQQGAKRQTTEIDTRSALIDGILQRGGIS